MKSQLVKYAFASVLLAVLIPGLASCQDRSTQNAVVARAKGQPAQGKAAPKQTDAQAPKGAEVDKSLRRLVVKNKKRELVVALGKRGQALSLTTFKGKKKDKV